jgi:hypothetical protein
MSLALAYVFTARPYQTFSLDTKGPQFSHLFDRDARDCLQNAPHTVVLTLTKPAPDRQLMVMLEYSEDRKTWQKAEMTNAEGTSVYAYELPGKEKGKRWFYRFEIVTIGAPTGDGKAQISRGLFTKSPTTDFYVTFEGTVPKWIMLGHVVLMMGATILFMFAFYWLMEMIHNRYGARQLYYTALWGLILFALSAFALGPPASGYAFGDPFGPWPFGSDITDTKSLYLTILWIVHFVLFRRQRLVVERGSRVFAWGTLLMLVISFIVFLIPHSLFVQS